MDEERRAPEPDSTDDPRSAFRRDRDRILYSTQFARLAEITQVVSPERGYVFHNRLTHSLKVAQLARTIADIFLLRYAEETERLGGIDPDAAEAAGLAHDLGHPPFGHIAEAELNRLVRVAGLDDGFEGNAQSLRIVCNLAVSDAIVRHTEVDVVGASGLNLTRTTLAGLIKYPWGFGENADKLHKWGHYAHDLGAFNWARAGCAPMQKTLIAEVMDWADDITYAIHDLLDFYRAGLIPLELVRRVTSDAASIEGDAFVERMFARRPEWRSRRREYESAFDDILEVFPFAASHRYSASETDDQLLSQFATLLITRYVNAIAPSSDRTAPIVVIQKDARQQVDVLKEFIWQYVILNPEIVQLQTGQRRAVRAVFRESVRAARKRESHFFPGPFRQRLLDSPTNEDVVRLAADYVSGLTERELLHAYGRFQGTIHR